MINARPGRLENFLYLVHLAHRTPVGVYRELVTRFQHLHRQHVPMKNRGAIKQVCGHRSNPLPIILFT